MQRYVGRRWTCWKENNRLYHAVDEVLRGIETGRKVFTYERILVTNPSLTDEKQCSKRPGIQASQNSVFNSVFLFKIIHKIEYIQKCVFGAILTNSVRGL